MHRTISIAILLGMVNLMMMSCVTTPLGRDSDDPYNAPFVNEPAPPMMRADEEACIRNHNLCEDLCAQDKDCPEQMICYESRCTDANPEF